MLKDKLSKIQVANIKDHGIRKLATLAKTKQRYAEDLLASYTLKIENELINKQIKKIPMCKTLKGNASLLSLKQWQRQIDIDPIRIENETLSK